jgi:CRP/FNR family transcriptional regulator
VAKPSTHNPSPAEAIASCRLWATAPQEALAELAAEASTSAFEAGEVLVAEGDPASRMGVLVAGTALAYHLGADGRRFTYEELGPADPVGAVSALAGGRQPASVEATAAGSVAWIASEAVYSLMEREPSVARGIVRDLAGRVMDFTQLVQTLSLDVPARVAHYLFQRALAAGECTPDGLKVDLGMRKAELAEALGTVPETISRALARLKQQGIVDVDGSSVTITMWAPSRAWGAATRRGSLARPGCYSSLSSWS